MTRTLLEMLIVATTFAIVIAVFLFVNLTSGTHWPLLVAIPLVVLAFTIDLPGRKRNWR